MAYQSGFLDKRIIVKQKVEREGGFGRNSSRYEYETVCCLWANVKWTKGVKAMQAGALDAYDTVMFRTHYSNELTRDKFIEHDNTLYQIMSYHADKKANEIQIIAVELPALNQKELCED